MELKIKVCPDDSCRVIVRDDTGTEGNGYLPESSDVTVKYRFKYSDTVSIDVLQHNKVDAPLLQTPIYTLHESGDIKNITLPVSFDGWFSVNHLVIPSIDWFNREKDKEVGSALNLYDTVYYSDGQGIYKYYNGQVTSVELSEIVERNTENTTISKIDSDYVSICFLEKCYISLCLEIFQNSGFSKCWNKNTTEADLTYRRDLVWAAINVIKYMVRHNDLVQAEILIEQIGGCNGLCRNQFKRLPEHKCGCGG